MPPVEFEPTISAGERPQTHALDRAATGTGLILGLKNVNVNENFGNFLKFKYCNAFVKKYLNYNYYLSYVCLSVSCM